LFLVAHADRLPGFALGPAQGGKQQAGQDGDNGDDNQQFDEGEPGLLRFHNSTVKCVGSMGMISDWKIKEVKDLKKKGVFRLIGDPHLMCAPLYFMGHNLAVRFLYPNGFNRLGCV